MRKSIILTWFTVLSILALSFPLTFSSGLRTVAAAVLPPKTLIGHVPQVVANGQAHLVGHHPGTDRLTLAIGLPLRNKQALDQFLKTASDPKSSSYGHYITQVQANQAFNPTLQQVQQVISWLHANGLPGSNSCGNNLIVDTSGTFAQAEHLLHITLNDYTITLHGKQISFYAPANEPTVDGSVSDIVDSIVGLDDYPRFHTDIATVHPNDNGNRNLMPPYYPQDFADAYDVNPLWNGGFTGSGQHIGITLWGTPPSDATLNQFHNKTGANVATQANGRLQLILVQGGSKDPGGLEAGIDVESTSGMAPGATIDYYEAPTDQNHQPTDAGLEKALCMAGSDANNNQQISNSWSGCEASSIKDPFTSAVEKILASNTATGHNYFFSSGDNGSACVPDPTKHPCNYQDPYPGYPASSVYATSVGGTTFSGYINRGYPGEVAWKYTPSTCPNPPQSPEGSGGGYSKLFFRPWWQTVLNDHQVMRGYPDIAADADPATGAYVCYDDNQGGTTCTNPGYIGNGTSLASPLWAGMMADVNQYMQAQGQLEVGFANPTFYWLATQTQPYSAYHDITSGINGKYQAGPGWDAVTGWGSPDLWNLARDIAQTRRFVVVPSPSPGPNNNALQGVTAVSESNVWAVGSYYLDKNYSKSHTLIEHWNGYKWNAVSSPSPGAKFNELSGVAKIAANDVWAVGFSSDSNNNYKTLTEHWDGSKWNVVQSQNVGTVSGLRAVAAIAGNDVWAVGDYFDSQGHLQTLTEHWDGAQWKVVTSANIGGGYIDNYLYGVAAISTNDVWVVGSYTDSNNNSKTLTEHWDGSTWSYFASIDVGQSDKLSGVTTVTTNDVWAVGRAYSNGSWQTLTEHWDGSQWTVKSSPSPGSYYNALYSVAFVSANDVWAVGYNANNSNTYQTLTEHWDGSSWSVTFSDGAGSVGNLLQSVAVVSAHDIWAVGSFNNDRIPNSRTLTDHLSDANWGIVPSPNPGSYYNDLKGVAVVSSTDVWAVGQYLNNNGSWQTLTEHWDGSTWSVVKSPNVGQGSNLHAVAVVSSTDVWAVGDYSYNNYYDQTLIEHWDGSSWSVIKSPNPGSYGIYLKGVAAVSSTDVWAVGDSNGQTLIEHWDGSSWKIVKSPNHGSLYNYLYGVAVVSTTDVWAVGYYADNRGYNYTLIEHWNGSSWKIVKSPNPNSSDNNLHAVAVVSSTDVWAVGVSFTGFYPSLIEHWDGSSWKIVKSPNPGSNANILSAVAVVSSTDVWAVGVYENNNNYTNLHTLTEHWDGSSWSVVSSPNPNSSDNYLYGVAVVSSTDVWAVGDSSNKNYDHTLVEFHP